MSAAAPSEALAASMLFPLGSAVSGEKENARCRILLPCLKQLQAQQNGTETMKTSKVKSGIVEISLADHDRTTATIQSDFSRRQIWSAVGSMTLCVAMLIASEFMPVSLLTPIPADLRATEGMAGQAIAGCTSFVVRPQRFQSLNRRGHLQIGELGSVTIFNTSCAFVPLLIVLQKLDDHFQIP